MVLPVICGGFHSYRQMLNTVLWLLDFTIVLGTVGFFTLDFDKETLVSRVGLLAVCVFEGTVDLWVSSQNIDRHLKAILLNVTEREQGEIKVLRF